MSWLTTARVALVLLLVGATASCGDGPTSPGDGMAISFDFNHGPQEWTAAFADYPAGQEEFMELTSGYGELPPPIGPGRSAIFISGSNRSDDLFMFFKRRVDGLRPDTAYLVTFDVAIATDVPHGCSGIGGSPGESVWLKAGVSTSEPITTLDELGHLRLTVDKGNQAVGGENAALLGTIGNSVPCELGTRRWETKAFGSGATAIEVTTDAGGGAWLFVGTDSGFEGTTTLYLPAGAGEIRSGSELTSP